MQFFNKFFFLVFLLLAQTIMAQTISLRTMVKLPNFLKETSGLETAESPEFFWTHNDGGDGPRFYKMDTLGNLLKTVTITNVLNIDIEDVAQDEHQNFYLADIGNNSNNRRNLRIYKISNPNNAANDSVMAEIIHIVYPNQASFPPDEAHLNFDAEAIVYLDSSLYLFSKNRTVPFTGYTYLYKIPSVAGTYTATLIDSFRTGVGFKEQFWITAADLSPDGKRLALLSSDKMFVFTEFTGDRFFDGKAKLIDFNSFTQKEALVFLNEDEFYVTDEFFDILGGQNLYYGNLKPIFSVEVKPLKKKSDRLVSFSKLNNQNQILLLDESKSVQIRVIDMAGRIIAEHELSSTKRVLPLDYKAGMYIIKANDGRQIEELRVLIH